MVSGRLPHGGVRQRPRVSEQCLLWKVAAFLTSVIQIW